MEKNRQYLILFTAGFGDRARFVALGMAFKSALEEAFGKLPTPLTIATTLDAQVWTIALDADTAAVGSALMTRLRKPFDFKAANPDAVMIVEVADSGLYASNAIIRTAFGLR